MKSIMWLMSALLVVACSKAKVDSATEAVSMAEQQEIKRRVDGLLLVVEDKDTARKKGMAAAGEGALKASDTPCSIEVRLPPPQPAAGEFDPDRMNADMRALQRVQMRFLKPDEASTTSGPLALATRARLRTTKATRLASIESILEEVAEPSWWDYDLVVVQRQRVDAKEVGDGRFVGGNFVGTAYLWSYARQEVACLAEIDEEIAKVTSREMYVGDKKVSGNFNAAAGLQLSTQVLERAVSRLKTAVPTVAR